VNCDQSKETQDYEESLRTAMSGIKEKEATAKLCFALGTRINCNGHDTCEEVVDFFITSPIGCQKGNIHTCIHKCTYEATRM